MRDGRWHRQILGALQLALCLLAATLCQEANAADLPSVTDIARVLRGIRLVEPRFSGGFDYAPCVPVEEKGRLIPRARCSDIKEQGAWALSNLESLTRRISEQAQVSSNPHLLHAKAVVGILFAVTELREAPLDDLLGRSIETLEKLQESTLNDISLLNDLGVACLIRAIAVDKPSYLAAALVWIDKAYYLAPQVEEVAFNRALILETLSLHAKSLIAWENLKLGKNGSSPWRNDARVHIERLSKPTLDSQWQETKKHLDRRRYPTSGQDATKFNGLSGHVSDWVQFELLPEWANALRSRDYARAMASLRMAAEGAAKIEAETRDTFISSEVREIVVAANDNAPDRLFCAAEIFQNLRTVHQQFMRGEYQLALDALDKKSCRTPAISFRLPVLLAEYLRAASLDQQGFKIHAQRRLKILQARISDNTFLSLWSRTLVLQARIENNLGSPETAIPKLQSAIRVLTAIRDVEVEIWARSLLGDSYRLLGDNEACWAEYFAALHGLSELGNPIRELAVFNAMSDFLMSAGEERLALEYQEAAVAVAPEIANVSYVADVLLWRSLLRMKQNDKVGALEDLRQARIQASQIGDRQRQSRFEADLALCIGVELLEKNSSGSIMELSSALAYFRVKKLWSRVFFALEARSRALRALGDLHSALRDLREARTLFARLGGSLKQDQFRIAFASQVESVFDQSLELELELYPGSVLPLSHVEEGRSVNSPPEAALRGRRVPSVSTIRRSLNKVALVDYVVLPEKLIIWLITRDQVEQFQYKINISTLGAAIKAMSTMRLDSPEWREVSEALGVILLGDVENSIKSLEIEWIGIIPDKLLNGIPFSILTLPHSRRFLLQSYGISICSSIDIFHRAMLRNRSLKSRNSPLQVVAAVNPKIDHILWPGLPSLRGASLEAAIAESAFSEHTVTLEGGDATTLTLQSRLARASWFHFAGHSVNIAGRTGGPYLLFSRSVEDSGIVSAEKIQSWNLQKLHGIVLSACDSATAHGKSWQGALGIVRPFLAAGVPIVIGSLWSIRDYGTLKFFKLFYSGLARTGSAALAFHGAQIECLRESLKGKKNEAGWLAFQLYGAPDLGV